MTVARRYLVLMASAALVAGTLPARAAAGDIATVAGGGIGDGGPALATPMYPTAVAVAAGGAIYVADAANHRIRAIRPDGTVDTVAGNGSASFGGDGGPGAAAAIWAPYGVAVDTLGRVVFTDCGNDRVRRVAVDGTVTTIAGTTRGYGGDGGPATAALLNCPTGIAVDPSGNVYVADTYNLRVRRIDPSGVITTVAGTGSYGFSGDLGPATAAKLAYPWGIAVGGPLNSLVIADSQNNRIRMVTAGIITTVAGDGSHATSQDPGPALTAKFRSPWGVAIDAAGTIFVADTYSSRIRRIAGPTVLPVAGGPGNFSGDGGPALLAAVSTPFGLALGPDGSVVVADTFNARVRTIDPTGIIRTRAGNGEWGLYGDGGPATSANLYAPSAVATTASGVTFVADTENRRVRRIDAAGIITTYAGVGRFGPTEDGSAATATDIGWPTGVAVDPTGTLYIANGAAVRTVSPAGIVGTAAEIEAQCVAVAPDGRVYAGSAGRVWRLDAAGPVVVAGTASTGFSGDGGPATSAQLHLVIGGIAFDSSGRLYVSDSWNRRVRRIDAAGIITTVAGGGSYAFSGDGGPATAAGLAPGGIALDASDRLFVADQWAQRIRMVDATGTIRTVAGSGGSGWESVGFAGDGGAATSARLNIPGGIAFDASGNLLVADAGNARLRRIAGPIP